jgi:hypothetical protein
METQSYGPGALLISEVLPAPDELFAREWVELYNPGVDAIPLLGWLIDDAVDGSGQRLDDALLAPGAFLVVELDRAILNNDGDSVRLFGPDGALIDEVAYERAPADQSISRDLARGSWLAFDTPSPGTASATAPAPERAEIAEALALDETANPSAATPTTRTPAAQLATATPRQSPPSATPIFLGVTGERYLLVSPTPLAATPTAPTTARSATPNEAQNRPNLALLLLGVGLVIIACASLLVPSQGGERASARRATVTDDA